MPSLAFSSILITLFESCGDSEHLLKILLGANLPEQSIITLNTKDVDCNSLWSVSSKPSYNTKKYTSWSVMWNRSSENFQKIFFCRTPLEKYFFISYEHFVETFQRNYGNSLESPYFFRATFMWQNLYNTTSTRPCHLKRVIECAHHMGQSIQE